MTSPDTQLATDESVITQMQPAIAIVPRVLLVDDDEIVIERLRDLITAAGYDVTTATSGDEALAALAREFAPIVILDRNMPGMDGARALPHHPHGEALPRIRLHHAVHRARLRGGHPHGTRRGRR